ncbi:TIGR02302 family protein [Kaistia sp. 32K]|uniref:TIGR02302 family protein n=1 Tax=Kaistia sp. 32K TaxID=2795690 RepID=UPI001915E90C|nr:TIGR02302 family protein [Kaistia sp. 32K]BCP55336.1 TIGR02302 family protein [Kaistia sp. 32K]
MTEPAGGTADRSGAETGRDLPHSVEQAAQRRIARATGRARLVLLWEALWPRLVPLLCLAGFFLILSWFGLWSRLADPLRYGVLALFGIAYVWLILRVARLPMPTPDEALARVARESAEPHRPATAFGDRLSQPTDDPLTRSLWQAHRLRLLEKLDRLKAGLPSPGMNRLDPYALRFLVPLVLIVAFLMAGPDRLDRILDAARPGATASEAPPRIDAWVTPPAYTGRPPIFLTGDSSRPANLDPNAPVRVPEGSVVTLRMPSQPDLGAEASTTNGQPIGFDAVEPAKATKVNAANSDDATAPSAERKLTLSTDSALTISRDGRPLLSWSFAVQPDAPPSIELTRDPGSTASGALSLAYALHDDYGVVGANAILGAADPETADGSRPLVTAPELPLNLPRFRMREGTGETIRDLSAHPWAGAKVKMRLVAKDEAGQTGESAPVEFVLPQRPFNNPLARAVVEQRRNLALDANKAPAVAMALDALTLDPDKFQQNGAYLALRAAYHRLTGARSDADLTETVDFLWEIALGIEDGDLSLAAQDLRAAQEALRKAIENNAPDAELEKAMQDLRAAMDKYLEALARDAERNPQANQQPMDPNAQVLRPEDLQKMMDQIENLAKTGSRDAAKQMLSQLQQMLENLEATRSQQGRQGQNGEMNQALDKLGEMIQRQQKLMDQTFKLDPDTDGSGAEAQPMTPEERQQALQQLREGQKSLQKMLQELQQSMQQQGMQPDGKLGQADRSMGDAADQLGEGAPGQAVGPQGQALQALREGARNLADQMARQNGSGNRQGGPMPGQDPLGRQQQGRGTDLGSLVKVPDAIDTQRAREILDMIRKRLGDTARPLIERDYLERLLQKY